MEFDQLMGELEELRAKAAAERFHAMAHQIEAILQHMRFRIRIYSLREPEIWSGETPRDDH